MKGLDRLMASTACSYILGLLKASTKVAKTMGMLYMTA